MGELQGEKANPNEIGYGIYGRHNGNHTFGLNTDGTAYLGDSSHAQLLFKVGTNKTKTNGTAWESTIQNDGYKTEGSSAKGMKLDFLGNTSRNGDGETAFSAPYIDIISPGSDNTINRATLSAKPANLLDLSANGQTLMHVGTGSYYLQTGNYAEGSAGTKIDLKSGSFKAFNGGATGALLISSTGYKNDNGGYKVNGNAPGGSG